MKHTFPGKIFKGFTLVEILVVVAVIFILSLIILPNYRSSASQFTLVRAAHKMAQDIRRASEMAMSAKECSPPPASCPVGGGVPPGGYGFYIDKGVDDSYKIYADSGSPPGPERYTSGEEIETIYLEKDVYIKDFNPSSANFSINFKPPAPTIKIKDGGGIDKDNVTITIALRADSSKTKTIKINKAGLIDVE